MTAVCQRNLVRVDQNSFFFRKPKALDVELIDVVVKAIVLLGRNRVKLIDLHKGQILQHRLLGVAQAIFFPNLLTLLRVPVFQKELSPFDKKLRGLPCRKTDDALRILRYPLQKATGSE